LNAVRKAAGKTLSYQRQLEKWSAKYDWVARAHAFDEYNDQMAREDVAARRQEEGRVIHELTVSTATAAAKAVAQFFASKTSLKPMEIRQLVLALGGINEILEKYYPHEPETDKPSETIDHSTIERIIDEIISGQKDGGV